MSLKHLQTSNATQPVLGGSLQFALVVGLVLAGLGFIVSGASLDQPPVWDGAMSVYPAALELQRSDFDYQRLLSLPTYLEGGPNTHAASLWTLLVAVSVSAFGSLAKAIPFLHVLTYILYGLLVAALYSLVRPSVSFRLAILATAAAAAFPTLLVQAADIYLDLPLACITTWALVLIRRRRYMGTTVLLTLGMWVKPLAVIPLAVFILYLLRDQSMPKRRLVGLIAPPVTVLALVTSISATRVPVDPNNLSRTMGMTIDLLAATPDTLALIALGVGLAILTLRLGKSTELFEMSLLMVGAMVLFAILNPLVSFGVPILPRYQVGVIPVLVIGIASQLGRLRTPIGEVFSVSLIAFYLLNLNGGLNPDREHATYSVAERSFATKDLLALQTDGIRRLEALGEDMVVYYDYLGHYQFQYPEMGYTKGPLPTGRSAFHEQSFRDGIDMRRLPRRFAFLYEYPTIGGEHLLAIWNRAKAEGASVSETPLHRGDFTIFLVEVLNPQGTDDDAVTEGDAE